MRTTTLLIFLLIFTGCEYDGPSPFDEKDNNTSYVEAQKPVASVSCKINGKDFKPVDMDGFYWHPRNAKCNFLQFTFYGENDSELFLGFYDSTKCKEIPFTMQVLPWPDTENDTMDYAKCEWKSHLTASPGYQPYAGSYINITTWERDQKRISGTFHVLLKNQESQNDTIWITEGKFENIGYKHGFPIPKGKI